MHKNPFWVIAVLFAICSGPQHAEAQATEATPETPNYYEFAGRKASMSFMRADLDGEAMFTYHRNGRKPRHFIGDEIRVVETEMGQTVTVTLWSIADLKTIALTVLIPSVNLDETGSLIFETKSLVTSHHTTIAGPDWVDGPLQTYISGNLLARASQIEARPDPNPGVFGKVTISPTCAGPQRPGQVCVGPLADTAVQLLDDDELIIETGVTDGRGFFAIRAEPGDYILHFVTTGQFPACPDTPVTISEGLTGARVRCDTGLR